MLNSAERVKIVRGNSVRLMEQGSFVTAVTVVVGLDCLWISRWKCICTNSKWPYVQEGMSTICPNSADGCIYNPRYSVRWSVCVCPD